MYKSTKHSIKEDRRLRGRPAKLISPGQARGDGRTKLIEFEAKDDATQHDYCKAKKLTKDLNRHSIQYATKFTKRKRKLVCHQPNANGTGGVSFRNPSDPH